MRVAVSLAVILGSSALIAGCGSHQVQVKAPSVGALRLSSEERAWFRNLGLDPSAPAANSADATKRARSIRRAATEPGVQIVSLKIYTTPDLAPALAPALELAVSRPAYFLRHQLKPILPHLTGKGSAPAYYLRIVDARARNVLEWRGSPARGKFPNEGSLYVRPGLESCSPIVALGWPMNLPPCPVE
jgi:hypothetical protein